MRRSHWDVLAPGRRRMSNCLSAVIRSDRHTFASGKVPVTSNALDLESADAVVERRRPARLSGVDQVGNRLHAVPEQLQTGQPLGTTPSGHHHVPSPLPTVPHAGSVPCRQSRRVPQPGRSAVPLLVPNGDAEAPETGSLSDAHQHRVPTLLQLDILDLFLRRFTVLCG